MVAFSRIKAGDILWDCHKVRQGNTKLMKIGSWPVRVLEVNAEARTARVSWNYNPAKTYHEDEIRRLRRTPAVTPGERS